MTSEWGVPIAATAYMLPIGTAWKQRLEKARQAAVLQGCAAQMAAIYVTAPIPAMVVHTGGAALQRDAKA